MFSLYVTVCIPRIKTYQMLYHISFWFVCIYTCYCLYHRHCGPGGSNNEYPEGEDLRDVDEEVLSFTQTSRQLHQRLPRKTQTTAGDTFVCLIPVRVVSFITVLQFLWARHLDIGPTVCTDRHCNRPTWSVVWFSSCCTYTRHGWENGNKVSCTQPRLVLHVTTDAVS